MKYLITFAYGRSVECLTDAEYTECHNDWGYPSHMDVTTSSTNINDVDFYDEIVNDTNNNTLRSLVEEARARCIRDGASYIPDWIKLVGITPIINDEIETVIDDSQLMHINDWQEIKKIYSNKSEE